MKQIPLTQGKFAIVDDDDFDRLGAFRWFAVRDKKTGKYYAGRQSQRDSRGRQKLVRMHREILGAPRGVLVDHVYGDTLDNRKAHLRLCTSRQNRCNVQKRPTKVSQYLGVHANGRNWQARVSPPGGKYRYLGTFRTEEEAARARDAAAGQLYGEFAQLNFPHREAA